MLACHHGLSSNNGMSVVGSSNHNSIGRLQHLVVHLTIITIPLGIGVLLEDVLGILPVAVTEANDVICLCHFGKVSSTASANTDTEDVQFVTGSFVSVFSTQYRVRNDVRCNH